VRSLAYALLNRGGDPRDRDAAADMPIKSNRELAAKFPANWQEGKTDEKATTEFLAALRTGGEDDTCKLVLEMLNRGVAPQSIWDALFVGAQELLARQPGIVAIHAVTSTNALHFAFRTSDNEQTRRLLLLQNAAFLPLFRQSMSRRGALKEFPLDTFDATRHESQDPAAVKVFAEISTDRAVAAKLLLGQLDAGLDPRSFIDAARLVVFQKGDNAHDYKYSSAVLEDYYHVSPAWRNRYLAASVFNLKGAGQPDNKLVERTRAALRA
jgi:hypothetical protein